jgi:hypothetical protein
MPPADHEAGADGRGASLEPSTAANVYTGGKYGSPAAGTLTAQAPEAKRRTA